MGLTRTFCLLDSLAALAICGACATGDAMNPRLYESLRNPLCMGNLCADTGSGKIGGMSPGERALDDKHPLMRSSEELNEAVGGVLFSEGGSWFGTKMRETFSRNFQSISAAYVKEFPNFAKPMIDFVLRIERETFAASKLSPAMRACVDTYFDAMQKVFTDDPVLLFKRGCVAADPDGTYETMVATIEFMSQNDDLVQRNLLDHEKELAALIERVELGTSNLSVIERQMESAMATVMRQVSDAPSRVDSRNLAPSLGKVEKQLASAGRVWHESTIYRACSGGNEPASRDAMKGIVQLRFELIRSMIVNRWRAWGRSAPFAALVSEQKLPDLSESDIRDDAASVKLSVEIAGPGAAGYSHWRRTIVIPNGLVAELCPRDIAQFDALLQADGQIVRDLKAPPQSDSLSIETLLGALFRLRGAQVLAAAEKAELEFVSALDFAIAHEFAHALFDQRSVPAKLTAREQELRADGFAYVIVDRTSEVSLFKRIANLTDPASERSSAMGLPQQTPLTNKALISTMPGGIALLRIYLGTRFERGDTEHPPMEARIQWVEKYVQQPLEPRAAN